MIRIRVPSPHPDESVDARDINVLCILVDATMDRICDRATPDPRGSEYQRDNQDDATQFAFPSTKELKHDGLSKENGNQPTNDSRQLRMLIIVSQNDSLVKNEYTAVCCPEKFEVFGFA